MADTKIRIAIIGGGLTGATLANALFHVSGLDVHVYESAPTFSERGASVALSSNALHALKRVIPASTELLARAGAVPINSSRAILGSGPQAGTLIVEMGGGVESGVGVHRAALLRELLAPLPPSLLHANKKLTSLTQDNVGDGEVEVSFEDGTVKRFDAVIGADGIFSSVRNYVLGDEAARHAPSPAGWWDCRVLVPFEKAKATIGEQYFDMPRQNAWMGDGGFILHDVLDGGKTVQCAICCVEKEPPKERKRPLTLEMLNEALSGWLDGPIAKAAIELMVDQPNLHGYSQWEQKSTPTYANGRVCIVGDAAHATTPWQGAGAGQAFEDAVILGHLMSNLSSDPSDSTRPVDKIAAAFQAFDAVRRPRCQRVIDSSRDTGVLTCGQDPDAGLNPDKMRAAFGGRWTFIFGLDLDEYKQDAMGKMHEFLGR
ncbi:salicylate hydroxylase [Podospora appendiculata]|uniref:Salicylate hydroxylase n=1 Tax=Podospora appendiculata TaxID=314037 RepID=A0AAE0X2G8_9PEZI|nr:salicylate hydroxylase [Podospora appendiculata]